MNITPELVKSPKEEGVNKPEYYMVECDNMTQALIVAEFFDADEEAIEFIRQTPIDFFPLRIGRLSDDELLILYLEEHAKLSMYHEVIDFKNWHTIRKEDTSSEKLYKRLGMDEKLYKKGIKNDK